MATHTHLPRYQTLRESLSLLHQVFADAAGLVPVDIFSDLYAFLASLDGDTQADTISTVVDRLHAARYDHVAFPCAGLYSYVHYDSKSRGGAVNTADVAAAL